MTSINRTANRIRSAGLVLLLLPLSFILLQCKDDETPVPAVNLQIIPDASFQTNDSSLIIADNQTYNHEELSSYKLTYLLSLNERRDTIRYVLRSQLRQDTLVLTYQRRIVYNKHTDDYRTNIENLRVFYHTFDSTRTSNVQDVYNYVNHNVEVYY